MSNSVTQLFTLYQWLIGGVLIGWILGRKLPAIVPYYLGQILYWGVVPIAIIAFLRKADLSGSIWIAPLVAWAAIFLGAGLAWMGLHWQSRIPKFNILPQSLPSQGSFLLASMVGNTGYIGFPVILALVGPKYFGWAVFYDGLGTVIGAYGLGVALAARFGMGKQDPWQLVRVSLTNPALISMVIGLMVRNIPFLPPIEQGLRGIAWSSVTLTLVLMGMRLSQLNSWHHFRPASVSLAIKMLIVPLVLGYGLTLLGLTGSPLLVLVLQMATPPAFATLVLAEAFNLDRELAVTNLAMGSTLLLLTLPLWLFLFGS
ncbi:Auxin Efflux Carrier [Planktothrix serta PCC 8927]|uniref:Auxin Efflux Carrier n=1 Tax=Planktothrix serta PCC 8927 TaxID=671068 RepID=A0A7Z9DX09_9CYAN|nr:AEC family transporter [Planktothrix serta]VXD13549.1 Auxin Efflux Carrier [Planktothrix serta PCC 8927]